MLLHEKKAASELCIRLRFSWDSGSSVVEDDFYKIRGRSRRTTGKQAGRSWAISQEAKRADMQASATSKSLDLLLKSTVNSHGAHLHCRIYLTIERTAKYSLSCLFIMRVYHSYQFLKIAIFNSFTRRYDSQMLEQLPLIFCFVNLEKGMYSVSEINIH